MAWTAQRERTWKSLEDRWGRLAFDGLTLAEREVVALYWLEAEVMNGGLHQYFYNSSGDLALYAVSGLKRVGALQSLEALSRAISKLGGGSYQIDQEKRDELLNALGFEDDPFDAETRLLQSLPEHFLAQALDRLRLDYEAARIY